MRVSHLFKQTLSPKLVGLILILVTKKYTGQEPQTEEEDVSQHRKTLNQSAIQSKMLLNLDFV